MLFRDLSAAEFFFGCPEDEAHPSAIGDWETGVLARATVQPRLTTELVHRFGAERDELWRAYASAIGWASPSVDDAPLSDMPEFCKLLIPERIEPDSPRRHLDALRPFVTLPTGMGARLLGQLVEKTSLLPSALWQLPVSEFLFTWRFHATLAAKERS